MINDDGINVEDIIATISKNGSPVIEVTLNDVSISADKLTMKFTAIGSGAGYSFQISAARRLTDSEGEFYNKEENKA